MILCDTNILIEVYRNNTNVISTLNAFYQYNQMVISDVTYAEMLVGSRNKHEMQTLIKEIGKIRCLPIQSGISTLSIQLLSKYFLSHGLDFHDALIAATAIFHGIELYTLNTRDFIFIDGLKLFSST